jgi:glyoxylase-like metal-dependent hydrolase (beta-lactamase superfamily II)
MSMGMRPRELSISIQLFPARTPTLAPATHTNSYALGAREVVLVEPATSYPDEQREWVRWARGLASQGRRPIALLVTHHHEDHVGGVDALARELGLPIWAHAETRSRLPETTIIDRTLADGDAIDLAGPTDERWTVLHTPGHAPGHVCLYEERTRTVIVGDMVASVGTILIAPGDGDMQVYLEQLERLAGLGARLALPAHGEPIDEPTVLFRRYVAHRTMREDKVLAAVRACGARGGTIAELVPVAYDDAPSSVWPFAMLSLAAHIEKLEREGRVRREDDRFVATVDPTEAS